RHAHVREDARHRRRGAGDSRRRVRHQRRRLRAHLVRRIARRDRHGNRAYRQVVARGRTMKRALLAALLLFPLAAHAQTEPDYTDWNRILKSYYDPARGMDYGGLK